MFAMVVYGVLWLLFGLVHSWLAGQTAKERLSNLTGQQYRLIYNLFAFVHTLITLGLGYWLFRAVPDFSIGVGVKLVFIASFLLGSLVLLLSLREYDLHLFAGLSTKPLNSEPLRTKGVHQYVRHPLYSGMFLLLFSLCGSPLGAATAFYGSVYLILGTYSEERKLIVLYGDSYRRYQRQVPAFIPWRGRVRLPNS